MNKLFIAVLFVVANLAASLPTAHALTISVAPSSGTIDVGGNVIADLVISGLGSGVAASTVGAFDVNIAFNPAIVSLNSVTFGALLGNPAFGEAITAFDNSTPGTVNLFSVSLLEASGSTCTFCLPPYLDALQPSTFVLATLSFAGLSQGTSALSILVNALGDGDGNDVATGLITSDGTVTVRATSTAIPEPGSLALMLVGFVGWMVGKRRC